MDEVITMAHSAIAALNIHGQTIDSLFYQIKSKLPIEISEDVLSNLKNKLKNIKIIIIDEKSFVGVKKIVVLNY